MSQYGTKDYHTRTRQQGSDASVYSGQLGAGESPPDDPNETSNGFSILIESLQVSLLRKTPELHTTPLPPGLQAFRDYRAYAPDPEELYKSRAARMFRGERC